MAVLAEVVEAFGEALGVEVLADPDPSGVADLVEAGCAGEAEGELEAGGKVTAGLAGVTLTLVCPSEANSGTRLGLVSDPK